MLVQKQETREHNASEALFERKVELSPKVSPDYFKMN